MSNSIDRLHTPDYQTLITQCIHCGLCLEACPTYAVFGTEMDTPRGRIALMRAAAQGNIAPSQFNGAFATHIDRCLGCRSCETACPSGVQYSLLLDPARAAIESQRAPGAAERFIRWVGLRQLMPHRGRLRLAARLLRLYQALGLQKLVRSLNFLPKPLAAMADILPPLRLDYQNYASPAPAIGPKRGTVAFFTGCIQDAFLAGVNRATVRVLQRNGYEVHFPHHQTCCGAAQAHTGDERLAQQLARQNIDAFLTANWDAIINNAGGCGLSLKEYPHLLKDDPDYAERARQFAARVQDINEFLASHLHRPPRGPVKARATYADSCHLRHGQKVVAQPRRLLQNIPGLELVELTYPDRCCGSAGVYNITQPGSAQTILTEKMADITATGATLIVTSNTGCHLQLMAGVRQARLPAQVMHVVEVLDQSYAAEDKSNS